MSEPLWIERFWVKVDKCGPNECWEWMANKRRGYGAFKVDYRQMGAHRVVFFLTNGYWSNQHICHICDNPGCVNPTHLFEGTNAENVADMNRKGRQAKGEKIGNAKLTDQQVVEIRKRYEVGDVTHRSLAKEYGVNHRGIGNIINRITWKHV